MSTHDSRYRLVCTHVDMITHPPSKRNIRHAKRFAGFADASVGNERKPIGRQRPDKDTAGIFRKMSTYVDMPHAIGTDEWRAEPYRPARPSYYGKPAPHPPVSESRRRIPHRKKRTEPMSSLLALVRFISYGRRLKTTVFRLFLLSYGFIPSAMLAYRSLAIGRRCRGCRMRQIHRRGIIRGGIAVSVRIRRLLLCGIGVSIRVRIGVRVPIG